jgi:protein-L-isoaspartate(D-aspartate) O-methyltransferase
MSNGGHETFTQRRVEMVQRQLARRGIRDQRVLTALEQVAREVFVPEGIRDSAYEDRALPVDCGQTISQPYIVGKMTEQLALATSDHVLEIGTGTGYQTAILAELAAEVFTIERHAELSVLASERLNRLGYANIRYRHGDGTIGWTEHAPYDAIIVTAGAPSVPRELQLQLAEGGRLVIPVGDERTQTLYTLRRRRDKFVQEAGIGCRFVKLVGAAGWQVEA